ncbi:hypothetical protein ACFQ4N_09420 [Oceanobacillus iheyensis]
MRRKIINYFLVDEDEEISLVDEIKFYVIYAAPLTFVAVLIIFLERG